MSAVLPRPRTRYTRPRHAAAATVLVGLVVAGAAIGAFGQTPAPSSPDRRLLNPDDAAFAQRAPDRAVVRLETTKGVIEMEVTRAWAPIGADRFVALVRQGYYDGNRFFRVVPGRWTQFGINGDPAIAKAWRTRTLTDDPRVESNVRGTVAFAFAVRDGRTTQVYFNLGDNSATNDPQGFAPFARVVAGMDAVDAINAEHREGPGGIRAGRQDAYFDGGNTWLDRQFPRLDYIKTATVR
jgi:peptidyl-prolyl cis-trans isomerase A (cyclophilin A)